MVTRYCLILGLAEIFSSAPVQTINLYSVRIKHGDISFNWYERGKERKAEKKFPINPRSVCVCALTFHPKIPSGYIEWTSEHRNVWPMPSMHKIAPKQSIPFHLNSIPDLKFCFVLYQRFHVCYNTHVNICCCCCCYSTFLFSASFSLSLWPTRSLARSLAQRSLSSL